MENSLPNGITLEEDGRLTGVAGYPAGTYHFSIDVFDAAHAQAHLLADLVVQAPSGLRVITDPLPPGGVIGEPYSFRFQAAGGAPPYAWTILQDAPPPDGLVLSADGTLSGTPTRGNGTIKVQVTDAVGATAFAVVPLSIVPPPLAVPPFNFPDAVVGRHYEFFMNGARHRFQPRRFPAERHLGPVAGDRSVRSLPPTDQASARYLGAMPHIEIPKRPAAPA